MKKTRPRLLAKPCEVCGTLFEPYRSFSRVCGRRCRDRDVFVPPSEDFGADHELTCQHCGAVWIARVWGGKPKYCHTCQPLARLSTAERKNVVRRLENAPDPERRRRINLTQNLRQYGLTVEQFEAMREAQGNRCAICGSPPDPNGVRASSRLHVDHDHLTKRVRELLCSRCNQGIGYFKDDPAMFMAAADYINKHRER